MEGGQQGFPRITLTFYWWNSVLENLTLKRVNVQVHKIEVLNSHLAFEHCISEIIGGDFPQEWGMQLPDWSLR